MVPMLGDKGQLLLIVLFCLSLSVSTLGVACASSDNWVEVIRFTGNESTKTEPFTIEHVEWRIRWNYSHQFMMHNPVAHAFVINVLEHSPKKHIISIGEWNPTSENGTWVHNENGAFSLEIWSISIDEYSIIIEQNIDSVPEFPSWAPLVAGFFVITILSIFYRRQFNPRRRK